MNNHTVVRVEQSGGIGFLGWLQLIFITLQLTGFINWKWYWVLSPILSIPLIIFVFFISGVIYILIEHWINKIKSKKSSKKTIIGFKNFMENIFSHNSII